MLKNPSSTVMISSYIRPCDKCPDIAIIQEFLKERLLKRYTIQWVNTDRSQLVEKEEEFDEFIETVSNKLIELTEHHYINIRQSAYFKDRKATLTEDECLIVFDFAENYVFIVQDASQSYHWNNSQLYDDRRRRCYME